MDVNVKNKLSGCFQEWQALLKHEGQQDCLEAMQECYQELFPSHTQCVQKCIGEFVIANYCEGGTGFFQKSHEAITDMNTELCIGITCPSDV